MSGSLSADRFVGTIVARHPGDGDHERFVPEPVAIGRNGLSAPMRVSDALDVEPGHRAEERR